MPVCPLRVKTCSSWSSLGHCLKQEQHRVQASEESHWDQAVYVRQKIVSQYHEKLPGSLVPLRPLQRGSKHIISSSNRWLFESWLKALPLLAMLS